MRKANRLWTGIGFFPPGGWEGSPYRFFDYKFKDGTKIKFDFWREIGHIIFPKKGTFVLVGSLKKDKDKKALVATMWLPNKKECSKDLISEISHKIRIALIQNRFVPNIKF